MENNTLIGIPEELKDQVFWVAGKYRNGKLFHLNSGTDIIIEYEDGQVCGYDFIKYPSQYVSKIFGKRADGKYQDYEFLDALELIKSEIIRVFARKTNCHGKWQAAFEEIWNHTCEDTPWEVMEAFDHETTTNLAYEDMVLVPHGTIQDGENDFTIDEFYMSKYLVTFDDYEEFCESENKKNPDDDGWGKGTHPVINVNFFEAIEYCNWKSIRDGFDEVYNIPDDLNSMGVLGFNSVYIKPVVGYRLCSVVEWSHALQVQKGMSLAQDSDLSERSSRFLDVLLMHNYNRPGNVCEWCWERYDHELHEILPMQIDLGYNTQAICGRGFESGYGENDHSELIQEGVFAMGRYPFVGFRLILCDNQAKYDKYKAKMGF